MTDSIRICGSCNAKFIGDNPSDVVVSSGPNISIDKFKLIVCSRSVKKNLCLTNNLLNTINVTNKPNPPQLLDEYGEPLTNNKIDEMVREMLQEFNIKVQDRFVTLSWIEDARKTLPNVYYPFHPTVVINDMTLSVTIHFTTSINEAYLDFLRPELVEGLITPNMPFEVLEGDKVVATGVFK